MTTTYTRSLQAPTTSFFLFGPRGTGKTTWLRQQFPGAAWFDLLRMPTILELTRQPELFRARVEALRSGSWVVVDEVQRLPSILDEVHSLIADYPRRFRFALSGSSARKLRRMDVNLLAGRAITRHFFPLTMQEMDFHADVNDLLATGCLPGVRSEPTLASDILEAYVGTYLQEEIQQEALTRDVAGFSRFLEVAALTNGQMVNVAGVARDAAIARPTVARYFEVLVHTLIGSWLPAWTPRARIKEVRHPKFYVFDPGVARAMRGHTRDKPEDADRGALFETLVLHELRAAMQIHGWRGSLSYWRTPAGREVDFIWERSRKRVGIEVKAGKNWRREDGAALRELLREKVVSKAFGVYAGRERMKLDGITILPFAEFTRMLTAGDVIG